MKKYFNSVLIILLLILSLLACKQQLQKPNEANQTQKTIEQNTTVKKANITAKELHQLIQTDSALVILDVRTPEELTGPLGHIDGVINIPLQVLDKNLDKLSKYKNGKIYVICRSGHRSGIATKLLAEKGFNVINVLGGMLSYNQTKK